MSEANPLMDNGIQAVSLPMFFSEWGAFYGEKDNFIPAESHNL